MSRVMSSELVPSYGSQIGAALLAAVAVALATLGLAAAAAAFAPRVTGPLVLLEPEGTVQHGQSISRREAPSVLGCTPESRRTNVS